MNITLSIEELQSYQDSMESWVKTAMLAEHVSRPPDVDVLGGIRSDRLERFRSETKDWLASHPMPKIVPKEL